MHHLELTGKNIACQLILGRPKRLRAFAMNAAYLPKWDPQVINLSLPAYNVLLPDSFP